MRRRIAALLLASALAAIVAALAPAAPLPGRTKTASCRTNGVLPDRACTPGGVFAGVTAAQICLPGYSSGVRHVTQSVKRAVYAEYGIVTHTRTTYEVDHLVPLELGGSNDIANLWPEPSQAGTGFHDKDRLENSLHADVCAGRIVLAAAQRRMALDWTAGAQTGASSAAPLPAAPLPPASDHPAGATAKCRDGTYSESQHHSGTCSHHGGVAVFYG